MAAFWRELRAPDTFGRYIINECNTSPASDLGPEGGKFEACPVHPSCFQSLYTAETGDKRRPGRPSDSPIFDWGQTYYLTTFTFLLVSYKCFIYSSGEELSTLSPEINYLYALTAFPHWVPETFCGLILIHALIFNSHLWPKIREARPARKPLLPRASHCWHYNNRKGKLVLYHTVVLYVG